MASEKASSSSSTVSGPLVVKISRDVHRPRGSTWACCRKFDQVTVGVRNRAREAFGNSSVAASPRQPVFEEIPPGVTGVPIARDCMRGRTWCCVGSAAAVPAARWIPSRRHGARCSTAAATAQPLVVDLLGHPKP